MAYIKTNWIINKTPINADNLNKIENGISANADNLNKIENDISAVATSADTNASNIGTMTNLENGNTLVEATNNRIQKYNLVTGGAPVKTGRKIDGQDEYVKRISIGTLPSSGDKDVLLGVTVNRLIKIEGGAYRSADGTLFPLPFTSANTSLNMAVWVQSGTYIRISVGTDRSALVGWVDVYYI